MTQPGHHRPRRERNFQAKPISILKWPRHSSSQSELPAYLSGDAMRRRDFIGLIGGAVVAWPRAARTQQSLPVIGFLHQGSLPPPPLTAIFRKGLVEAGVVDGQGIRIEQRAADGQYDRLPALAADLVSRQVTVMAADFLPAALAAKAATQTIPIVFLIVADPVGAGIVDNLARPGGNTTGLGNPEGTFGGKLLSLLKRIAPRMRRAAAMFNPDTAPGRGLFYLGSFEAAARSLAIAPLIAEVRNDGDIERVITTLGQEEAGLVALPDNFMFAHRGTVIGHSIRNNVPTIYDKDFAKEGGLLQYGASFPDMYRRVPSYVDRILRGAKPRDLPVQLPTKYEFVINLKTARAIGLDVSPDMLSIADEVIE